MNIALRLGNSRLEVKQVLQVEQILRFRDCGAGGGLVLAGPERSDGSPEALINQGDSRTSSIVRRYSGTAVRISSMNSRHNCDKSDLPRSSL
jgi:hypothetical protein